MKLPNGRVMVGSHAVAILYRKKQNHACDPKCKAAGHLYRHPYKKSVPVMASTSGRREITVPAREYIRRDGAREHYAVDNPPLLIVNSPERRKKKVATIRMKRNSKGRFVAARSNGPRKTHRRKKARKNPPFWTAGALVNGPRKHAKRRRARRNPPSLRVPNILGIPLVMPDVADVLGIAGGLAGPPIVKGFAMQLLPASLTTSTAGKWGVELGSYAVPAVAGYMIGGRRTLRMVFAGQLAGVVVRLVQQATARITASLAPGQPSMAGYLTAPRGTRLLNGYVGPVGRTQLGASPRGTGRVSRFNAAPRWAGRS